MHVAARRLATVGTLASATLVAYAGCALLKSGGTTIQAGASQENALVRAETEVSAAVEVSPEISAVVEASLVSIRASLQAEFAASFEAQMTAIRGDVAVLQARDVSIGGGGDSVTSWIYALIVGAAVLYPIVIRPSRKFLERRRRTSIATGQDE